jgi:hypothetical protein
VSNRATHHNDVDQDLSPDIARLSQDVDNCRGASSLLRRLTGSAGTPREHQTIAREAACGVQGAGEVPRRYVQSCNCDDKPDDRHGHRNDDVPATLVNPVAVVHHGESDQGADQIRRSRANESYGVRTKVESSHDRRVEIVETVSRMISRGA